MSEVSNWQATIPKVIGKAWSDPAFESQLLSDPKAALQQFDLDAPDDMDVKVVKGQGADATWSVENVNNAPVYTLTIPPKPAGVSAEALAVGDSDGVTVCCSICCCCE
jgi:ribosomally synthesized peptide (two-chain TOMM family)